MSFSLLLGYFFCTSKIQGSYLSVALVPTNIVPELPGDSDSDLITTYQAKSCSERQTPMLLLCGSIDFGFYLDWLHLVYLLCTWLGVRGILCTALPSHVHDEVLLPQGWGNLHKAN